MTKTDTYTHGQVREDGRIFCGWTKTRTGKQYPIWRTPDQIERGRKYGREWARSKSAERKAAKSAGQSEIDFAPLINPVGRPWTELLSEIEKLGTPRPCDTKKELRDLYAQLPLWSRIQCAFKMIFKIV